MYGHVSSYLSMKRYVLVYSSGTIHPLTCATHCGVGGAHGHASTSKSAPDAPSNVQNGNSGAPSSPSHGIQSVGGSSPCTVVVTSKRARGTSIVACCPSDSMRTRPSTA